MMIAGITLSVLSLLSVLAIVTGWLLDRWLGSRPHKDCLICNGRCCYQADCEDPDRIYNLPPDIF